MRNECYGCEKRHMGCHAKRESYKAFAAKDREPTKLAAPTTRQGTSFRMAMRAGRGRQGGLTTRTREGGEEHDVYMRKMRQRDQTEELDAEILPGMRPGDRQGATAKDGACGILPPRGGEKAES